MDILITVQNNQGQFMSFIYKQQLKRHIDHHDVSLRLYSMSILHTKDMTAALKGTHSITCRELFDKFADPEFLMRDINPPSRRTQMKYHQHKLNRSW